MVTQRASTRLRRERGTSPAFLGVGRITSPSLWSASRHRHDFVEMMVILGGRLSVSIGAGHFLAGPGDVLFYGPGEGHQEQGSGAGKLDFIFLAFRAARGARLPPLVHDGDGRVRILATWLWDEQCGDHRMKAASMQGILVAILAETAKMAAGHDDPVVAGLRSFMRGRLADPLSVADLAKRAGMSRAHFIRQYHQRSGLTPMDDLRRIRVETARHLLITTREPLKTIAERTGFCDECHLSRVFKRILQVAPGYFRKG